MGDILRVDGVDETQVTPLGSVVDRSRLWEDNTVYYVIDDPTYSECKTMRRFLQPRGAHHSDTRWDI